MTTENEVLQDQLGDRNANFYKRRSYALALENSYPTESPVVAPNRRLPLSLSTTLEDPRKTKNRRVQRQVDPYRRRKVYSPQGNFPLHTDLVSVLEEEDSQSFGSSSLCSTSFGDVSLNSSGVCGNYWKSFNNSSSLSSSVSCDPVSVGKNAHHATSNVIKSSLFTSFSNADMTRSASLNVLLQEPQFSHNHVDTIGLENKSTKVLKPFSSLNDILDPPSYSPPPPPYYPPASPRFGRKDSIESSCISLNTVSSCDISVDRCRLLRSHRPQMSDQNEIETVSSPDPSLDRVEYRKEPSQGYDNPVNVLKDEDRFGKRMTIIEPDSGRKSYLPGEYYPKGAIVTKSFLTRFWVLGFFSLLGLFQTAVWGTWGPMVESAQYAFPSWTDATIAMFPNWAVIDVLLFIIPFSWFYQRYGLRYGVLLASVFVCIGTGIRCLPGGEGFFTIYAHAGSFANGLAGPFVLSLSPAIAAVWFPPHERTTATAVSTLSIQMGGAAMYLRPIFIRPSENATRDEVRGDIQNLMYVDAGISVFLFLCILIYFPEKPPIPPSASSSFERLEYFPSFKKVVRNLQVMLVIVTFALSFGIPVVWIGVMNLSLECIGITQSETVWVGIVGVTSSGLAAFTAARITDRMVGYLRVSIMALLTGSSLFFFWFLLNTFKVIPPSLWQAYLTVAGGISLEFASVPLLFELAMEVGYPSPEGIIGAFMAWFFNFISFVFLLLFLIPTSCFEWVSVVLACAMLLTNIPMYFVKEEYKRSEGDVPNIKENNDTLDEKHNDSKEHAPQYAEEYNFQQEIE